MKDKRFITDFNPEGFHWLRRPYQVPKVKTTSLTIPIPLSDDKIITIGNLPINLTKEDAEKICRVVTALSE